MRLDLHPQVWIVQDCNNGCCIATCVSRYWVYLASFPRQTPMSGKRRQVLTNFPTSSLQLKKCGWLGEEVETDWTYRLLFGNASSLTYISIAERLLCWAYHEREYVKGSAARLGARLLLPANRSGSTWSMAKRLPNGQVQVHKAELVASREILFEYLTLG